MADCRICAYAKVHGSWPLDHAGTHCRRCCASWTGTARAHCNVCHETFASNKVADLHWPRGRHKAPAECASLEQAVDDTWVRVGQGATYGLAPAGANAARRGSSNGTGGLSEPVEVD